MSTFAQMHNDYLDPDRAGVNDEQAIDLRDDCGLIGYGKRGHGLNGKNADLDYGGQNVVKQAWWREDGRIEIVGRRYATICPPEDDADDESEPDDRMIDMQAEIIGRSGYSGHWSGDDWCLGEDYELTLHLDWDDAKDEEANIAEACRIAFEAICDDSEEFENAMTETAKAMEGLS